METASSCSRADMRMGRAPAASTIDSTSARSSSAAPSVTTTHAAPLNSAGDAARGPERSLPAIGCVPTNREGFAAATTGAFTPATSMTRASVSSLETISATMFGGAASTRTSSSASTSSSRLAATSSRDPTSWAVANASASGSQPTMCQSSDRSAWPIEAPMRPVPMIPARGTAAPALRGTGP